MTHSAAAGLTTTNTNSTTTQSAMPEPVPTAAYAAAYAQLTAIAQKLRAPATATTVDGLAADVRAAREAYAICRTRLEAIRREVDEAIGSAEEPTAA